MKYKQYLPDIPRHTELVQSVACLLCSFVATFAINARYVGGLMLGLVFVGVVLWAMRQQDLAQWELNVNGRHYHDGKFYKLVEESEIDDTGRR